MLQGGRTIFDLEKNADFDQIVRDPDLFFQLNIYHAAMGTNKHGYKASRHNAAATLNDITYVIGGTTATKGSSINYIQTFKL